MFSRASEKQAPGVLTRFRLELSKFSVMSIIMQFGQVPY